MLSCLPLLSNASIFSNILGGVVSVVKLVREVIDMFTTSTEEKQLEHLTQEMSTLKRAMNSSNGRLLQMMKETSYKTVLTDSIDKIESCEKDYYNYLANKSNATRKNLEKCHDIIENVRKLGKYLSGKSILNTPPLLDLYKENGVCDGAVINGVFKYVFSNLAVGCSVVRTTEALTHESRTNLYDDECKTIMNDVLNYMESEYNGCAPKSCNTFHNHVNNQLASHTSLTLGALHGKLSEMYPWFNFLVFKFEKGGKATEAGNFSLGHDDGIWLLGHRYDIFYFDARIQISQQNQKYLLLIEVHEKYLNGSYFGNVSMETTHYAGGTFKVFQGYASENNVYCAKPNTYTVVHVGEEGKEANTYTVVGEEGKEGNQSNGADPRRTKLPVVWCILIVFYFLCG